MRNNLFDFLRMGRTANTPPIRHRMRSVLLVLGLLLGSLNVWGAIDANSTWTATAFADIPDGATVIIINNFGKTLANATVTKAPAKVEAAFNSTTKKITVTGKSLDEVAWTVEKATNGTKFWVYGSKTNLLGVTKDGDNNAVGVGTTTNVPYNELVLSDLLKPYNLTRFIGEYVNGSDWRSYNSATANNYKSGSTKQALTFYVLDAAPADPFTVTLMDNRATLTEESAGAGVTLPSRDGCEGYTFAGWTNTWTAAQSSWTETAPEIISASTYHPSADENLYPVYTKTEISSGSGFTEYTKIALGGTITDGKYLISTGSFTMAGNGKTGAKFTPGSIEKTEYEYTISVDGDKFTILGPDRKYIGGIDKTALQFADAASGNGYSWKYVSTGIQNVGTTTRHIKGYQTNDFRHYATSNGTLTYLYKRTEGGSSSTTYYISEPSCCTKHAITASGIGGELTLEPDVTEACVGTEITLTANSPDGSHQGTGTIKVVKTGVSPEVDVTNDVYSAGTLTMPDYAITITATYAEKSTPSVSVTPVALDFGNPKKGDNVDEKKFTLTGSALEAGTLNLVAPEGFELSPSSIVVAAGSLAATEITVTPNTGTAGDKSGNITISGAGIESTNLVALTMTVQETYTVNWFVNGTKIDANSITDVVGTAVTAPSDFSAFTDCQDLTFVGWKEGSAIDGGSTTEAPSLADVVTTIPADNKNYYAVFAEGTPGSTEWEKATSVAAGEYLIVYETGSVAFDGSLPTLDAVGNTISVTISDSKIAYSNATEAAKFTIVAKTGGYSIKSASNLYIGQTSDANGLATSETDDYANAISISGGNADIICSSAHLRYNNASNQTRFRYYKSTSYSDQKAIQLYKKNVSPANFTKWYTTCPHCNSVALIKAGQEHGTFALQRNSADVTSVNTCEAVTVDVVASPATGYELTNIELSELSGASYNSETGKIELTAGTNGDLTVTATFSQKNYEVIVEEYPVIGATLTGATTTAHYNDEITISTNEPAGYKFSGWCMYEVTDIERETDIADQFFAGDYDEYEFATTAKFKMPNRSIVAEANFKKIYSVDEFMDTEFTKTNNKWYYVTGLVAEVPAELYSGSKMTYVISDDATKSGLYLTLYRGLGEDGENFSAVSDLAVGDKVVVYGQWTSSYKNMNEGNYILKDCLTKKALSALTIVGDASVTTYDVGDSFDKTGLSLTATYNTGYTVANYSGTSITSDYDAPTTFTAGVTQVIVSAEEGLISTSRAIPVIVSSAVLDHVEISAAAQTEFWAKEQYKEPLLDAYLTDDPATILQNVTGVSNTEGLDMSVAGNKSVTVTYTRKLGQSDDVEYNFTIKAVVVDEAHAHSVATAREIIDLDNDASEDLNLADNATKTHVKGIVKSVQLNSGLTGGNAQYNGTYNIVITDEADATKEMTLYRVSLKSGITSVEENDLIKACGNLYWYEGGSKYEINTGGQVVWKQPKVSIEISNQTMEVDETLTIADVATIDPAAAPVSYAIVANDDNCITLNEGVIRAVTTGTATVSINVDAYEEYLANSKTFTVTVKPAAVHTSVVILAEYDGRYYALDNAAGTTEVQMCGGKVVVADEATKNAIVWDRAERDGVATFHNATVSKYLNGGISTTLSVAESEGTYTSWTWVEKATKAYYTSNPNASTVRTFLYQSGQGIKNYAVSNIGNSVYAQPTMYTGEIVVGEITTLRGDLFDGKWGTYCPDHDVKCVEGASFYTLTYKEVVAGQPYKVFFDEVEPGAALVGGKPYLFIAEGEAIKGIKVGDDAASLQNYNGFTGVLSDKILTVTSEESAAYKYYIVYGNEIRLCGAGQFYVPAERAYLNMSQMSSTPVAPAPGRRRISLVNHAAETATGMESVQGDNVQCTKVLIDGELFILRGEKMYDATGRLVK